jgi:hypothetical protein
MWAPSVGDTVFFASPTLCCIDRIYDVVRGAEEVALVEILHYLGALEHGIKDFVLSRESAVFPVVGEKGQNFLLSASQEKGIRFHFPRDTPPKRRNEVLNLFAAYLEVRLGELQEQATTRRSPASDDDATWWSTMKRAARGMQEQGEPLLSIGKISYEN